MNSKSPVLLIAFNRPDTTQKVFNSIKAYQPKKLYVAIDGPRHGVQGERDRCKAVLDITSNVDWDCDSQYLVREKNLGCQLGVYSAISWALENEDRIIIIEDDIVAVPAFFSFANVLLEKYKDDERIAMISANQYTSMPDISDDYVFTKYGHIWGWATWKRVWDNFDMNLPYLENDIETNYLKQIGLQGDELNHFIKRARTIQNSIENGTMNTWDSQFGYFRLRNQLISIAPRVNLASNIGTTSSRTGKSNVVNRHFYPSDNNFVLNMHPQIIECSTRYDKHHFRKHINKKKPLFKRLLKKVFNSKF